MTEPRRGDVLRGIINGVYLTHLVALATPELRDKESTMSRRELISTAITATVVMAGYAIAEYFSLKFGSAEIRGIPAYYFPIITNGAGGILQFAQQFSRTLNLVNSMDTGR